MPAGPPSSRITPGNGTRRAGGEPDRVREGTAGSARRKQGEPPIVTAVTALPSVDVVCLGESMVTFIPTRPGRLADVPSFERGIGGAESNVACALARAGHSSRWLSRVGTDGFGDHLLETIAAAGVDVAAVRRDSGRPTGIYFRTAGERPLSADGSGADGSGADGSGAGGSGASASRAGGASAGAEGSEEAGGSGGSGGSGAAGGPAGSGAAGDAPVGEVVYYRAGSAAAAMAPGLPSREEAWSGRILHLSGITAALSADCLALLRDLTGRGPGRPLVSFDVNHRAGLWAAAARRAEAAGDDGSGDGPAVLAELVRRCDLVFVGEDEAEAAWGLHGAAAVREAFPEPDVLVVKQGSRGATVFARQGTAGCAGAEAGAEADAGGTVPAGDGAGGTVRAGSGGDTVPAGGAGDTVHTEPALRVDVVAPVGAGDAFAAGFLSATLRGLPVPRRIRHGHLTAAAALTVPGDLGDPPARELADRLAGLPSAGWETLRLGPGWTSGELSVPVEARTP
ncbi:carbohydrate kinase [Streptomyces sp. Ru87]|nr:carbohydrate kinase [Streptomyces sp. Ru87]